MIKEKGDVLLDKSTQLNSLLMLRNSLCGQKHVLPYMIFTEECAKFIVEAQPRTIEELGKVKGFPANGKRIKNYGAVVLDALWKADRIECFDVSIGDESGDVIISPVIRDMQCF